MLLVPSFVPNEACKIERTILTVRAPGETRAFAFSLVEVSKDPTFSPKETIDMLAASVLASRPTSVVFLNQAKPGFPLAEVLERLGSLFGAEVEARATELVGDKTKDLGSGPLGAGGIWGFVSGVLARRAKSGETDLVIELGGRGQTARFCVGVLCRGVASPPPKMIRQMLSLDRMRVFVGVVRGGRSAEEQLRAAEILEKAGGKTGGIVDNPSALRDLVGALESEKKALEMKAQVEVSKECSECPARGAEEQDRLLGANLGVRALLSEKLNLLKVRSEIRSSRHLEASEITRKFLEQTLTPEGLFLKSETSTGPGEAEVERELKGVEREYATRVRQVSDALRVSENRKFLS